MKQTKFLLRDNFGVCVDKEIPSTSAVNEQVKLMAIRMESKAKGLPTFAH